MIWRNGAVADNIWINNAYRACKPITKPWVMHSDMCVRTFVHMCSSITGINFQAEEVRTGKHHVAIDDCRHQIAYILKARNALYRRQAVEDISSIDSPESDPTESHEEQLVEKVDYPTPGTENYLNKMTKEQLVEEVQHQVPGLKHHLNDVDQEEPRKRERSSLAPDLMEQRTTKRMKSSESFNSE